MIPCSCDNDIAWFWVTHPVLVCLVCTWRLTYTGWTLGTPVQFVPLPFLWFQQWKLVHIRDTGKHSTSLKPFAVFRNRNKQQEPPSFLTAEASEEAMHFDSFKLWWQSFVMFDCFCQAWNAVRNILLERYGPNLSWRDARRSREGERDWAQEHHWMLGGTWMLMGKMRCGSRGGVCQFVMSHFLTSTLRLDLFLDFFSPCSEQGLLGRICSRVQAGWVWMRKVDSASPIPKSAEAWVNFIAGEYDSKVTLVQPGAAYLQCACNSMQFHSNLFLICWTVLVRRKSACTHTFRIRNCIELIFGPCCWFVCLLLGARLI